MRVLLPRTFFTPLGRFRKSVPSGHPVEVPDELRAILPTDAVVVEDDYKEPELEKSAETLSEAAKAYGADPARAAAESLEKVTKEADENRAEIAAKFKVELDAEKEGEPKRGRGRSRKS